MIVTDWNMPITSYPHIVDRDNELEKIYRSLVTLNERMFVIEGAYGVGKTFLAKYYSEIYREIYTGGITYCERYLDFQSIIEGWEISNFPNGRHLVVADELSELSHKSDEAKKKFMVRFKRLYECTANIDVLLIGNSVPEELKKHFSVLKVPDMTYSETMELILKYYREFYLNNEYLYRYVEQVFQETKGNSRQILNAMNMLSKSQGEGIGKFEAFSGIVDINGKPLKTDSKEFGKIKVDLACANDEVFRYLKNNPHLIHKMSPREFELFVASILERMGYTTKITPQTRDGGIDIFAAKKDDLGSFLYILQCKKQNPSRPVGVGVIREMYGVLQFKKATHASVITTSYFTKDALDLEKQLEYQMSLLDFNSLKQLLFSVCN